MSKRERYEITVDRIRRLMPLYRAALERGIYDVPSPKHATRVKEMLKEEMPQFEKELKYLAKEATQKQNMAVQLPVLNLGPAYVACPCRTPLCERYCYAIKMNATRGGAVDRDAINMQYMLKFQREGDLEGAAQFIAQHILHAMERDKTNVARINEEGDIYNDFVWKAVKRAAEIIREKRPDAIVYLYTKSFPIVLKDPSRPDNLVIIASLDRYNIAYDVWTKRPLSDEDLKNLLSHFDAFAYVLDIGDMEPQQAIELHRENIDKLIRLSKELDKPFILFVEHGGDIVKKHNEVVKILSRHPDVRHYICAKEFGETCAICQRCYAVPRVLTPTRSIALRELAERKRQELLEYLKKEEEKKKKREERRKKKISI